MHSRAALALQVGFAMPPKKEVAEERLGPWYTFSAVLYILSQMY
jgi:hypothetical protein